jgi:hypothetical protein
LQDRTWKDHIAWYLTTKLGVQGCTSQKVIILIFTVSSCLAWVISCWPLIKEAWIQSQTRPCGIISGKRGTGMGTLVVPSQYHTNSAPYSFIHSVSLNKKKFTTLRPSQPTHARTYTYIYTHTHTHTHIFVGVHFVTPSLLSMKRGRNEKIREGRNERGRVGGRQLCVYTSIPQCFGHRTLFNLVHIYRTHMFCGPSFII